MNFNTSKKVSPFRKSRKKISYIFPFFRLKLYFFHGKSSNFSHFIYFPLDNFGKYLYNRVCYKVYFCFVRLAQLDRAFGYGPKGRGFESSNAR